MILMAADYVGYHIVDYICKQGEKIETFVYDTQDRGNYNDKMISMVRKLNPKTEIISEKELKDLMTYKKQYEIGFLAWWPYILSEDIINMAQRGFINTHPGFLPYNRGKHPYFWSIVEGTKFGVTLHYVNKDIDAGEIIAQREILVTWQDTGESLYKCAREEMIDLFRCSFKMIIRNEIRPIPQDNLTFTSHFGKELEPFSRIEIDSQYTARELLNICRGRMFNGVGAASFIDAGKRYNISINITEVPIM